jgi:hypothetical protein
VIYLYRQNDGSLGIATDTDDREWAERKDRRENWCPGSNREALLDTAQMAARKAGLWAGSPGIGGSATFPHGPICIHRRLLMSGFEQSCANVARYWESAEVIIKPEGPYCTRLPLRRVEGL